MTSLINPTNIDGTYPIAGQDNDSQGFRDNFTNIKNNLDIARQELSDLQGKVVLKSSLSNATLDNDMSYAAVVRPQLKAYSESFHQAGNNATLDYSLGNLQQVTTTGDVQLAFSNWPTSGQVGKLTVWLVIGSTNGTIHKVTFPSSCTIGFPAALAGATVNQNGSITITFTATGDYFYEFMTVDGGVHIRAKQV